MSFFYFFIFSDDNKEITGCAGLQGCCKRAPYPNKVKLGKLKTNADMFVTSLTSRAELCAVIMACWKKSGEITDVLLPDPEEPPAAPCC